MEISNELTPLIYKVSRKVFEKELSKEDGIKQLPMNSRSAKDYIDNFGHLVKGECFKRTMNAYSIDYFFENISKDYGYTKLQAALNALILHIEYYYEGIQKERGGHKMREIHSRYSKILTDNQDELEENEIIKEIKNQKKTKEEIAYELKNLKTTDSEEVIINSKSFKRDNKTIALIKLYRDFKCQICSTTILKKDGTFYIEAAHIEAKHKKGRETPDNILLLCPNHHKEFDLGERNILHHDKDKINFVLNGQEFTISLKI